jgi:formate-dependent nitrite reductase membrane component NrfD
VQLSVMHHFYSIMYCMLKAALGLDNFLIGYRYSVLQWLILRRKAIDGHSSHMWTFKMGCASLAIPSLETMWKVTKATATATVVIVCGLALTSFCSQPCL